MASRVEWMIARRLRLGTPGGRERVGVAVGVAGIALAVVVMLLSLAVIAGFKSQIRAKVDGFEAQISVLGSTDERTGETGITPGDDEASLTQPPVRLDSALYTAIASVLPGSEPVLAATRPMMLKTPTAFLGVVAKGYERAEDFSFAAAHIEQGKMLCPDSANQVILSRLQATKLEVEPGDKIDALFFDANGGLRMRRLRIVGIYNTHFDDYDLRMAYLPLKTIASIDNLPPFTGTRIELNGLSDNEVDRAADRLQDCLLQAFYADQLTDVYRVDTAHRRGAMYYNWLALLDTNVVVILVLMAIVATFTLISSLFVLVLERVNMIGLLKALGATNGQTSRVFVILCERIVARGLLIGNAVGLLLIGLQWWLHLIPLDSATYFLDYVPVRLTLGPWLLLNVGVIAVSALVLILPARVVGSLRPASTLRFE